MRNLNGQRYFTVKHLLLVFCLFLWVSAARAATPDIRVLIDVSGSMKKNDPRRLRGPALRLLVGLLPKKTKAGVWTFGQWVNMQVKLGYVTRQWKNTALRESRKIHSRGLRTNIEDAIRKASFDWKKPDPRYRRSLILLTDGMVDISRNPALNAKSRNRILTKLLPQLRKAGVSIHTIALSPNADHRLLKSLSRSTGGWYEYARSAKNLHKIFLRMFEKSTNTQTVPMKGNRFVIDKSITDMTLLVFTEDKKPVIIHTPGGKRWTASSKPASVKWFQEDGYTLITTSRPRPGKWYIQAATNPDNRVMVVTNLRLKVSKLPNFMLKGEKLNLNARLLKKGRPIQNRKFLRLAKFLLDIQIGDDSRASFPIHDNGKSPDRHARDGIYTISQALRKSGRYQLTIIAKGPTFQRQKIHYVQVYESPVSLHVSQEETGKPVNIEIRAKDGIMQAKYSLISIKVGDTGKPLIRSVTGNHMKISAPAIYAGRKMTIIVHGKRFTGEQIKWKSSIMLPGNPPAAHRPPKKKHVVHKKPDTGATHKDKKADSGHKHSGKKDKKSADHHDKKTDADHISTKKKPGKHKKKKKKKSWVKITILVILINGLLIGLAVGGYLFWKKRSAKSAVDDMDDSDE